MNILYRTTQKDVERNTLIDYLRNKGINFNELLIDPETMEPTDIRYDKINYQITVGDQEAVEERRRAISREGKHMSVRSVVDIAHLLLFGALTKKVASSDPNTILLIEVVSTGGRGWADLEDQLDDYTSMHLELRGKWKEIYAVFSKKNIQLYK